VSAAYLRHKGSASARFAPSGVHASLYTGTSATPERLALFLDPVIAWDL
jgi:hypothetical protein